MTLGDGVTCPEGQEGYEGSPCVWTGAPGPGYESVVPPVATLPAVEAIAGQVVGSIMDFRHLVAAGMPTPSPHQAQGPMVFWGPDEAGRFIGGPAHLLPGFFTPVATQPQDLPGAYPLTAPQPSPKRVEKLSSDKPARCNSVDSGHDDTFSETESTGFDPASDPTLNRDAAPTLGPQPVVCEAQPCYYPGQEPGYHDYAPVGYTDSYGYYDNGDGYYANQYVPYPVYDCHGYPTVMEMGQPMAYPGYYGDQTVSAPPFTSYQGPHPEYKYAQ